DGNSSKTNQCPLSFRKQPLDKSPSSPSMTTTSLSDVYGIDVSILDHRNREIADGILAVQLAAYQQEAALLRVERFPPLDRNVFDILESNDDFFGARIDDVIVGVFSLEAANGETPACISSMTVIPEYQRRGVARALMSELLRAFDEEHLTVSTGMRNEPALALYRQFGFAVTQSRILREFDLEIAELRRGPKGGRPDVEW
ncbi:GNAT family N-acetyltransferase, partial [Paraburkholderia tropica]|uniref:GNAT family N-acetyltransferase n=1 Tax=Paraburkholderia tropica TaxID=92647 RepID=UPI001F1A5B4D